MTTGKPKFVNSWMARSSRSKGAGPVRVSFRKPPGFWYSQRTFLRAFYGIQLVVLGLSISVVYFYMCRLGLSDSLCSSSTGRMQWLDYTRNQNQFTADSTSNITQPIKIAHVVSLITCSQTSRTKGFVDALMILRHSIHQNSVHATNSSSVYSYQMLAIVREDDAGCREHVPLLERLGYRILLRPNPVNISAITTNDWYRNHVQYENCCGAEEFVKLYAYTLTDYPIVVHWDLDTAVLKPMDDLFDAMLFTEDTQRGEEARLQLQLQPGLGQNTDTLPERIEAFFTRDVTSAYPWEKVRAVQGGFVVLRPNMEHFQALVDLVMHAKYTPGRGPTSGWGGLGYGGFQGAMAFQGILAYFYDMVYPGHAVELDVCRWNQVVADVIYRGPKHMELNGTCRQYPHETKGDLISNTPENGRCYDCRVLPVNETRTVHYTACKKPWECTLPFPRKPGKQNIAHTYRLQELTNVTTCQSLLRKYFEIRQEIEALLRATPRSSFSKNRSRGKYEPETFLGYCAKQGSYLSIEKLLGPTLNMTKLYGF